MNVDAVYKNLVEHILADGEERQSRNFKTYSLFGTQLTIPLNDGVFPLMHTKRMFWRGIVEELLWFLRGETNAKILSNRGVHIWDDNAPDNGELGPIYGAQWRGSGVSSSPDQLRALIRGLITDPSSRRHIVNAWNSADLPAMALPPCHMLWQVHLSEHGMLSLMLTQRSCDVALGLPFNIASYALLVILLCEVLRPVYPNIHPGKLVMCLGDVHIYADHMDGLRKQVENEGPFKDTTVHIRRPFKVTSSYGTVRESVLANPTLQDNYVDNAVRYLEGLKYEDIALVHEQGPSVRFAMHA